MAFAPRTWLYLTCLWLSIATALGHAVAPVGSPLARTAGSAFSASTTDVALAAPRIGLASAKPTAIDDGGPFAGDMPFIGSPAAAVPARFVEDISFQPVPADPVPSFPRSKGFDARAPPRV
ncbi:hypothetical protein RCO27_11370 [Sphingosinicella sp. LHD-64]|uniref:hypothetical protein n=1 Tax=Sphingosinicella sp. LHD-64 TaxID=3072139 RepID=UPI00280E496E|nr:hypothetical protein [Sphingosinicella sp. LHD-64]MDQ8756827.1 hypothetical protein [Sphingosinicella sp. LHD-64]